MAKRSKTTAHLAAVQVSHSSLDDVVIPYQDMPSCSLDRELLTDLSTAYIDPFTGRYFHNMDEASQYSEIVAVMAEEQEDEYADLEAFGAGYKPWMGRA